MVLERPGVPGKEQTYEERGRRRERVRESKREREAGVGVCGGRY